MVFKMSMNNDVQYQEQLPRPGSSLYNLNHPDDIKRMKILKKYKKLNKYLILPLYKIRLLPLLGFGRLFLILTTKGRISGKKRKTPLEYHWIDGVITIFSGRGENSDWFKNINVNPDSAWIRHGFHSFQARIEILRDENDKLPVAKWFVTKQQRTAKFLFGWNPKIDDPETTDFSKLLDMITILRVYRKAN